MPKHLSHHCVTFSLIAVFLLAGCGQKGPLYLEKTTDTTKVAAEKVQPINNNNKTPTTAPQTTAATTEKKEGN